MRTTTIIFALAFTLLAGTATPAGGGPANQERDLPCGFTEEDFTEETLMADGRVLKEYEAIEAPKERAEFRAKHQAVIDRWECFDKLFKKRIREDPWALRQVMVWYHENPPSGDGPSVNGHHACRELLRTQAALKNKDPQKLSTREIDRWDQFYWKCRTGTLRPGEELE